VIFSLAWVTIPPLPLMATVGSAVDPEPDPDDPVPVDPVPDVDPEGVDGVCG
jgi:hypothetical protein